MGEGDLWTYLVGLKHQVEELDVGGQREREAFLQPLCNGARGQHEGREGGGQPQRVGRGGGGLPEPECLALRRAQQVLAGLKSRLSWRL